MPGESPYEAFESFRRPLQLAISCINSEAHLWALSSDGFTPGIEHALVPNGGEPVRLTGERDLWLSSLFRYRVMQSEGERGPWKVRTTTYMHTLEDREGLEAIAWHWHPGQGSAFDLTHLHIGRGIGADLGEVHKFHVPTGRVALEDVIGMAIREFEAEPQRLDFSRILEEGRVRFETWRTWS